MMKNSHPASSHECRFSEDAVRHHTGEIYLPEFQAHLEECPSCQQVGAILERLRSAPHQHPSENLSANILSAIQQPETKRAHPRVHYWAAAAAVVIGLTIVIESFIEKNDTASITLSTQPISAQQINITKETDSSLQDALDWFCRNQENDGSWSPERWGGDPQFKVALTALPMLAILSADAEMTPQRSEVIAKALQYLQSSSYNDGRFGPQFYGSSYNQGIATLALLSAYKHRPNIVSKKSLDNALAEILSQQNANGWWGLSNSLQPDLSISLWQVEALKMAVSLGWKDMQPQLTLGTKWIAAQSNSLSAPLDATTSAKEVNYFHAYFATTLLKEANDESSRKRLSSIRHTLLRKQVQRGTNTGSWTPDDRWGQAGGRLYTTALASLSLQ